MSDLRKQLDARIDALVQAIEVAEPIDVARMIAVLGIMDSELPDLIGKALLSHIEENYPDVLEGMIRFAEIEQRFNAEPIV